MTGSGSLPYNGTAPNGGDSLTFNLNQWFAAGDLAWTITAGALVWLMIPGVGFFYSGLSGQKSALSLIMLSCLSLSVVTFQWFFWGYSLVFSRTGGRFMGNLDNIGFKGVLAQENGYIPDILYAFFQGMFGAFTPALVIGAAAERGRILPCIVFLFVWATLVYDPIASWTWNPNGWAAQLGVLDFAGGTPVHITSGASALAFAWSLSGPPIKAQAHNSTYVGLGTVFLWFGWLGFNGGSARGCNLRSIMACVVSNLAASCGGLTWLMMDYYFVAERKWGFVSWCSGAIAGLVAITPAAGFVPPWSAVIIGIFGAMTANVAGVIPGLLGINDQLDIFAIHAIGGITGNLLTSDHLSINLTFSGVFAADYIAALDGITVIKGGAVNGNGIQIAYQLCNCVAGFAYAFAMTSIILLLMSAVPCLQLQVTRADADVGIDLIELGEVAYKFRFPSDPQPLVEITTDVNRETNGPIRSTTDENVGRDEIPTV